MCLRTGREREREREHAVFLGMCVDLEYFCRVTALMHVEVRASIGVLRERGGRGRERVSESQREREREREKLSGNFRIDFVR
jgi:hypothetical protein